MSDPLYSEQDLPSSVISNQESCQVCFKNEANTSLKSDLRTSLHFCKACLLPVHKSCYGLPSNSEKLFFCDRCLESGPSVDLTCEICHSKNGALKKAGNSWVHVTCAISLNLVTDWETMSLKPLESRERAQTCSICQIKSVGTIKCMDCDLRSHYLCALKKNLTSDIDFITHKRFYCDEHILNHEKYCFCTRGYIDGQDFMIACDCCDIWYHGECMSVSQALGEKIEHYLCRFCDNWSKIKVKLEKEDINLSTSDIPTVFSNFKLKDWLFLARAVAQRGKFNLERKAKTEEIKEALDMIRTVPFVFGFQKALNDKLEVSIKLAKKEAELLPLIKDNPDEGVLTKLQNFMSEVKSAGVVLQNMEKISIFIENSKSLLHVREILDNSKLFTLTQVKKIYEEMMKKFSKDLDCIVELKKNIVTCENWFALVKDELKTSQTKPLGSKLTADEVKSHLNKAKSLPFSMQMEIRIVEDELKSAEDWDKKYKSLEKPIHPSDLHLILQETESLAVETQYMRAASNKYEDFNEWVKKTKSITNPSSNALLPYIDQVTTHLSLGESEIAPYIDCKELVSTLKGKIEEAVAWQTAATSVLSSKTAAQKLSLLVREAKTIVCQFPELELIEKRVNVNKKISDIIHKRHKEEELFTLLSEGLEIGADDEFIQALYMRIENVKELKAKVKSTLDSTSNDPLGLCTKLLEDLKNSRVELPDEKFMIEERLKSIKWLQNAKDTLKEIEETKDDLLGKKKKGEWDLLKGLVAKGEKIGNKDPFAEAMLQELILKLWEMEYCRFSLCDEVSLEQIKDLEIRANSLKTQPESLEKFQDLTRKIEESRALF